MFFDDSKPDRRKRADKRQGIVRHINTSTALIPAPKSYELLSTAELFDGTERTFIFDTESYPNYWLAAFKCAATGKIIFFEDSPNSKVNCNLMGFILHRFRIVGFKSTTYDLPVIAVALQGVPAWKLKEVSNELIVEELRPYDIEKKYGVKIPECNHIDLIDVAPIEASLKVYSARIHCERLQDLPFPENQELQYHEALIVRDYCINDLDLTHDLFNFLEPQIKQREQLGAEYGLDLRSKSDAQIAEAVIVSELEALGTKIVKPHIEAGWQFKYQVPDFISFKTPQFQHALEVVRNTVFTVGNSGAAECPPEIAALTPRLGSCAYELGVGGLHSREKSVAHFADKDTLLIDRDVTSYYPYIILNNELFPEHLGPAFLKAYRSLVMRRLKLKKEKNPLEAGLKIAINGTFGKLGNFYSAMYSPDLLLQVCMTGQLCLLMLIEAIELAGIPVVSANTDGIVIKCPKNRYDDLSTVVMIWENLTGFNTEDTHYEGIFSRDVNNYITVKTRSSVDPDTKEVIWHHGERDGVKTKGVFAEVGSAQNSPLSKNPECYIASMAVQDFLEKGTPIADTVYSYGENVKSKYYRTPISRFVSSKKVNGGAQKNGVYLGKAVRWYYAKGETGPILGAKNGHKVGKSDGGKPLMILPTSLPDDIDFDQYINIANEILYSIGYFQRAANPTLF
jgi:hypothetical protein